MECLSAITGIPTGVEDRARSFQRNVVVRSFLGLV